jgi:hypothetical protein
MTLIKPNTTRTFTYAFEYRETRNYPVLAICENIESYVIKHNRSKTPCNGLAIELIAHYFLKLWEINTPEIAIVNVNEEHIEPLKSQQIQGAFFKLPCFGSRFHDSANEFNKFYGSIQSYEKERFSNKNDFLKLALFDIWMANEDRTENNPNFLIEPNGGKYHVMAIDHESCFNSGNIENVLSPLTFEDSILYHRGLTHIVGKNVLKKENLDDMVKEMYLCVAKCKKHADEILSFIPLEWQINTATFKQLFNDNLFNDDWLQTCKNTFFEHANAALKQ